MANQSKGKNANARVGEELYFKIQELADLHQVSVGHIIRLALQTYIWAHPLEYEVQRIKEEKERELQELTNKEK